LGQLDLDGGGKAALQVALPGHLLQVRERHRDPAEADEEFFLTLLEVTVFGRVRRQRVQPALYPDEFRPKRVAILVEPMGTNQARGVVVRALADATQEGRLMFLLARHTLAHSFLGTKRSLTVFGVSEGGFS